MNMNQHQPQLKYLTIFTEFFYTLNGVEQYEIQGKIVYRLILSTVQTSYSSLISSWPMSMNQLNIFYNERTQHLSLPIVRLMCLYRVVTQANQPNSGYSLWHCNVIRVEYIRTFICLSKRIIAFTSVQCKRNWENNKIRASEDLFYCVHWTAFGSLH